MASRSIDGSPAGEPPDGRSGVATAPLTPGQRRLLFVACFAALVATSMAFGVRIAILGELDEAFGLAQTQVGEIFGAGLWPFAISIVLFSLVVDRVGFGNSMVFAFGAHLVSAVITIFAGGFTSPFWGLYLGAFICALANGTVEAVINPVVAAMYPRSKTLWLTILHAGWPIGITLGLCFPLLMPEGIGARLGGIDDWQFDVAVLFLPTLMYGAMMLYCRWPRSERVEAGVSYRAMLAEVGGLGIALIGMLVFSELTKVAIQLGGLRVTLFDADPAASLGELLAVAAVPTLLCAVPYGVYTASLGRPLFIVMLVLMIPLAITELGTDSWIKSLLENKVAAAFELDSAWVLVYTASLMVVMRFCIAPIVNVLQPLGVLAVSAGMAAIGIFALSALNAPIWLIAAATVYGIGQAFFWPVTLGFVAEQFPRGGPMTLNTVAGVGMLGVGIIGTPLLGNLQDHRVDAELAAQAPQLREVVVADEVQLSVFGPYQKLDARRVGELDEGASALLEAVQADAKLSALAAAAILPVLMCISYTVLIVYFKRRGGYRPVEISAGDIEPVPASGG